MIPTVKLINTSINIHSYTFFVYGINSFSKHHYINLLLLITVKYLKVPGLIHLIAACLYLLTNISPFHSFSLGPSNHQFAFHFYKLDIIWVHVLAQTVKRLTAMRKTGVWFLGWEDPLEKEMAIHSSTLAWKIPWTEEPDRLQSMGSQRVGHDWATSLSLSWIE